jgi:hypothetical protein
MVMVFNPRISDLLKLVYRFRIAIIVALVLFLGLLIYPFKSTTVPQWNLRVLDDEGAPVREINVTEHWQHYPLDAEAHQELQRPNQDGFVSFNLRSTRASLVRRLYARMNIGGREKGERLVPYAAIVAWGSKAHATTVAVYQGSEIPPAEIRVQRLP